MNKKNWNWFKRLNFLNPQEKLISEWNCSNWKNHSGNWWGEHHSRSSVSQCECEVSCSGWPCNCWSGCVLESLETSSECYSAANCDLVHSWSCAACCILISGSLTVEGISGCCTGPSRCRNPSTCAQSGRRGGSKCCCSWTGSCSSTNTNWLKVNSAGTNCWRSWYCWSSCGCNSGSGCSGAVVVHIWGCWASEPSWRNPLLNRSTGS